MQKTKSAPRQRGRGRPREESRVSLRSKPEALSDLELIDLAIKHTKDPATSEPITYARFAEIVLRCNTRTLRKYRGEGRALNPLAREKLQQIIAEAKERV